jgi:hypothetical protein
MTVKLVVACVCCRIPKPTAINTTLTSIHVHVVFVYIYYPIAEHGHKANSGGEASPGTMLVAHRYKAHTELEHTVL